MDYLEKNITIMCLYVRDTEILMRNTSDVMTDSETVAMFFRSED